MCRPTPDMFDAVHDGWPLCPVQQVMAASSKELKGRIDSVKNTQKITEAMKLVAAAKVRRAQDAVINGRPFAENLVKVRARVLARVAEAV